MNRWGCRAKEHLEAERQARLESEEAAAQLRKELVDTKKEHGRKQKEFQKNMELLQTQFKASQLSPLLL